MNKHRIKKHILSPLIWVILLSWTALLLAQTNGHIPSLDRGDPNLRRKSNLDGNNLRTTVFNFGFSGRTSAVPDEIPYEWPKNTDREYVALAAIWMGGEVVDENGETIPIIDFPTYRQDPSGGSWNLEPVPGFLNPDGKNIAKSDEPDSWPTAAQGGWRDKREDPVDPGWIGSWNGFFGKNVFNADQEMFYRCSDDLYDRFNYIPDTTDPTRGGMGLLMDVRAMAWSQVLINDAVFFVHDILNDGTKRISKTAFLIWLADIVGGDAPDDMPFVDLQTSIAFLTDADRIGTEPFGNDPVGVASIKYLETPGNQIDGIDNDGDADLFEHADLINSIHGDPEVRIPHFTDEDFQPRQILPGDKIVLIDSLTYERRVIEYPAEGGVFKTLGWTVTLPPGGTILTEDTLADLRDNDLDGLIDERLTLHLERFDEITGTVRPVRYINYLSFEIGDTIKRGFIVAGKDSAMSYATVAPMIDEARDDHFDNDRDWNAFQDDYGLDGVEGTGDPGEGDGIATSGAGTDFPGELNIDKTDVSEGDMIGITSALQDPAFNINFNTVSDRFIWRFFMTPGKFYIPRKVGEYDTYVSSGYFPIEAGQRQRMAISVAMAGGGLTLDDDLQSAIQKQKYAQQAFESDYDFAKAPIRPTVWAVPGDGKVTLYWDDKAEYSEDRFIKRIGGEYKDFEGYRIYRATDAAFLDAKVITNAQGVPELMRPIAQFDLVDGKKGLHPVDINGVMFDLGKDTGLKHTYVDSPVVNGQRYFYAVTAYDFGFEMGNIAPSETLPKIDVDPEGNVKTGSNVVVVRPRAPVAGYIPAAVASFEHIRGSTTSDISFEIVDPMAVRDGHEYEITFEDTLIIGTIKNELKTKNFTVRDVTTDSIKLDKSTLFGEDDEVPLIDGFRLHFRTEERVKLDKEKSGWSDPNIYEFQFSPVQFLTIQGEQRPADYRLVFGEIGIGHAIDTTISFLPLPGKDVNFTVYNIAENKNIKFAMAEIDGSDGKFSINPNDANKTDTIYLLEEDDQGKLVYTWQITMNLIPNDGRNPDVGDTMTVYLKKPFLSRDIFRFTMKQPSESKTKAKQQLDNIRVVPNPYIAAEVWEPRNPYNSGRGPRELHFINLPRVCTIRIFNVSGVLIDKIEHNSTLDNGTAIWDMLSRENLSISYGIYLYHIDAPGIGQKTGTFAIIK